MVRGEVFVELAVPGQVPTFGLRLSVDYGTEEENYCGFVIEFQPFGLFVCLHQAQIHLSTSPSPSRSRQNTPFNAPHRPPNKCIKTVFSIIVSIFPHYPRQYRRIPELIDVEWAPFVRSSSPRTVAYFAKLHRINSEQSRRKRTTKIHQNYFDSVAKGGPPTRSRNRPRSCLDKRNDVNTRSGIGRVPTGLSLEMPEGSA
ncbi:hypothetical protein GWI33_013684 [Rhynchophorus ferrugineus]|uniref:Uncharacterized protein n=1 Tax=Rhynchophorus ferrugineus TaxID=354439 RepID=A0A834I6J1_RHYFE|nr:hypothetical protein GWI33_013684 [Rhynchophorus ferrugineus]